MFLGPPWDAFIEGDREARLLLSHGHSEHIQSHHGELEAAILWLMDTTFESTDPAEKARLATAEMRARLVLKRFRKQDIN